MSTFITLEDARQKLGEDTFIVLEPAEAVEAKRAADKETELWGFDLATGQIRRGDGKFHAAGVVRHPGGWNLCAIIEEPDNPDAEVIGHVIVDVNPRGLVRVRTNKGLSGEILELKPSSLSKGELDASGRDPDGLFEANPQRLKGKIGVFRNNVDFPDEEGLAPAEFAKRSTDGRSLSALAVLGLY